MLHCYNISVKFRLPRCKLKGDASASCLDWIHASSNFDTISITHLHTMFAHTRLKNNFFMISPTHYLSALKCCNSATNCINTFQTTVVKGMYRWCDSLSSSIIQWRRAGQSKASPCCSMLHFYLSLTCLRRECPFNYNSSTINVNHYPISILQLHLSPHTFCAVTQLLIVRLD